jgi:hypothetical protein
MRWHDVQDVCLNNERKILVGQYKDQPQIADVPFTKTGQVHWRQIVILKRIFI